MSMAGVGLASIFLKHGLSVEIVTRSRKYRNVLNLKRHLKNISTQSGQVFVVHSAPDLYDRTSCVEQLNN